MKAQTYNFETWVRSTDPEELKSIKGLLVKAGFGIVGFSEHYYKPQGYSCIYLLSESHLAIHTYPEENCTSIQLSSCVKKPFNSFINILLDTKEGGGINEF